MKRLFAAVLFLTVSCTTATIPPAATNATAPAAPVHIVLVGTTDVHGWFAGHNDTLKDGSINHWGGLAILKSYVDALRTANDGHVVLVDSGDLFQGTLESNIFEGEPVVKGYNALGYAAAAVGNHEFDYGPVGPDSVVTKPGQDPLGALKLNASMMNFPMLSANMTEKATGATPAWAHRSTMVTVAGVKIGIIGLSTPDTPNVTMPANVTTLDFNAPVPAAVNEAADLRARGADMVIVIAHMGGRCTDLSDVHDVNSCESEHEAMQFLRAIPKGTIDAYFAGHTHSQMRQYIEGVPAVQALAYSREFSTLDVWIDGANHRVERTEMRPLTMLCTAVYSGTETCDPKQAKGATQLVPRVFEGKTIVPDAKVAAMFTSYLARVAEKRNEPVGIRSTAAIPRSYYGEAPLGNLLTDLMRSGTGADIAFINSGGIRAELPAGDLRYSDVFEVSPFDNFPTVVPLTGAQIAEMLRLTANGEHGILQVSGLKYTYDATKDADKPPAQRQRVLSVTLPDGTPVDPTATYKVVMPDFLAVGGDGLMPVMKDVPKSEIHTDQSAPLRELFVRELRKRGAAGQTISPAKEGRVTVLNATSDTTH
ncbi:MAG TPA: 5'-nucleotidase C-terminal domain-containing protein [Thermoanaerobaculia bacterium]|nr:5'-nucleotidase C-terminal domain-containing protein [Thermoanaerobaculia bacterium]